MDQLNEFFVYLSTPDEASGIFSGWPSEMNFAVLADATEGFTIVLFHRDQEKAILKRIAQQRELAPEKMHVVPEVDGHPSLKIGVSREMRIQKWVEAEKDLPEKAGDYLMNYTCAKDLSPEDEYFGDDFADPDADQVEPDGTTSEPKEPLFAPEEAQIVPVVAASASVKDYTEIDDENDLATIWKQDMKLERAEDGRVLLAVSSATADQRAAAELVERLRLRHDLAGFFISTDNLPELEVPCIELPSRLASIFLDPTSGKPAKMRVLVSSEEGWHITAIQEPVAPPPPAPPRPALTLPPPPEKPGMGRVLLNVAAGCILGAALMALGAGGVLYLAPAPTEAAQPDSPTLDEDYLDLLRTRIFDKVDPKE